MAYIIKHKKKKKKKKNSLHPSIKQVAHDINKFTHKVRKFLIVNSFYSVHEYFDWNNKLDFAVSQ
jgi:hypothetical protein